VSGYRVVHGGRLPLRSQHRDVAQIDLATGRALQAHEVVKPDDPHGGSHQLHTLIALARISSHGGDPLSSAASVQTSSPLAAVARVKFAPRPRSIGEVRSMPSR